MRTRVGTSRARGWGHQDKTAHCCLVWQEYYPNFFFFNLNPRRGSQKPLMFPQAPHLPHAQPVTHPDLTLKIQAVGKGVRQDGTWMSEQEEEVPLKSIVWSNCQSWSQSQRARVTTVVLS